MSSEASTLLSALSSLPQFLLGVLLSFGVYRYYVEPRQIAGALRVKYGSALWIACKELSIHLRCIGENLDDDRIFDRLLKIPSNDWKHRPDWFTKKGFYTMVTAHKIALVSAWLYIYQQELLFSRTRTSSDLLAELYNHASSVRKAFSENSCLWPEYFDAVGSQCVELSGGAYRPLTFSAFCLRYASDDPFLRFYDQLHWFIQITAKEERDPGKTGRLENIGEALRSLMQLLEEKGLLAGLQKDRIGEEISKRSVEASELGWQDDE